MQHIDHFLKAPSYFRVLTPGQRLHDGYKCIFKKGQKYIYFNVVDLVLFEFFKINFLQLVKLKKKSLSSQFSYLSGEIKKIRYISDNQIRTAK